VSHCKKDLNPGANKGRNPSVNKKNVSLGRY
jgi:hypothetical protein